MTIIRPGQRVVHVPGLGVRSGIIGAGNTEVDDDTEAL